MPHTRRHNNAAQFNSALYDKNYYMTIDYQMAARQDYAFTLKYNRKTEDINFIYNTLFEMWKERGVVIKFNEVHENTKVKHYHGLISVKRNYYLKRLMLDGFHLKLEAIYNEDGWYNYCKKEDLFYIKNTLDNEEGIPGYNMFKRTGNI